MKLAAVIFYSLFAAANASAYFDGGFSAVTGPNGYHGSKLDLAIGAGGFLIEPSWASYTSDSLDSKYRTYAMRVARENELVTIGAQAGYTPEAGYYSNKFAGADITFSLSPGKGGKARLAGPGSRSTPRGGQGVTRIDVGASAKQTRHEYDGASLLKTTQNEYSLFAGAKVLMLALSGSYTGYGYGKEDTTPRINPVPGHSFAYAAAPKSSVSAKVDLPGMLILTPFVGYTGTKYRHSVKDSAAYMAGAYVDLNMVAANVTFQVFDNGVSKYTYVTAGAGIKF
ncbi:MAG TPA: hypothetical protein PL037_06105 [Elusimicrobiales bacterium]|nr:hypothetical protein [Elusimicrobiales bacterium]